MLSAMIAAHHPHSPRNNISLLLNGNHVILLINMHKEEVLE
jgi:hypothetical protein